MSLLYVRSSTGRLIPLESVARLRTDVGPTQVSHYGQLPAVTIGFNLRPGFALGDAVTQIQTTAAETLSGIDLTGRLAVVTGGYSGIGLETTRALSGAGAHVVVPARRPAAAEEALAGIVGVVVDELDLGDVESVAGFADRFVGSGRAVDLMIDNAGIMACPETRVGPGW